MAKIDLSTESIGMIQWLEKCQEHCIRVARSCLDAGDIEMARFYACECELYCKMQLEELL